MFLAVIGFIAGRQAQAGPGGLIPGSGEDPLVAESYVHEALSVRLTELQGQVAELKDRVQKLKKQIE